MNRFATIFLLLAVAASAQPFTERDIAFLSKPRTPTDWEQRVIANGGAQPSLNTINAMETLRIGCIAAGLTNKIYSLCVFVPDSLIAATTPLFIHQGATLWTNFNFGATNITVNGLGGDGTTKVLDTGIKAKDVVVPSAGDTIGLTVIVTESASNHVGHAAGQQDADGNPALMLLISAAGLTEYYPTAIVVAESISTNDWGRVGYVSGNRWIEGGNTNIAMFVASPLESHKAIQSKVGLGNAVGTTLTDDTISFFASKRDGTNQAISPLRMSLAMVHDGFTQTESSNFWVLARTCRETLGGGTGDPVHDWNRKIVAAGGANISTTTSNAARTFLAGLDTDGTLYTMLAVNPYVPDNLTAARTPIIWQAGAEVWTNNNFGATNLTVDGLTGDGSTKYLGTAIVTATAVNRGFSETSAGMSMIVVSNNATGRYDAGVGGAGANSHFAILNENGLCQIYIWRFNVVNANFLIATGLTNGFLSGNRTAANAIALYRARSDTTFGTLTNGTGAQTGTTIATHALAAFALNSVGTVSGYSPHQVSYLSIHAGHTSTQSSNEFVRAQAFRTAIGGGAP